MKVTSAKSLITSSLSITFAITAISLCGYKVNAQKNNAVYAELGGNGYYYSINYERSFSNKTLTRGGIGVATGNFVLPLLFGKYFGNGNHHLEVDLGLTYVHGKINPQDSYDDIVTRDQYFVTAFLGYRYQNPDKKSLFRVGYTPLYKIHDSYAPFDNNFLFHWAGVSYGFRF